MTQSLRVASYLALALLLVMATGSPARGQADLGDQAVPAADTTAQPAEPSPSPPSPAARTALDKREVFGFLPYWELSRAEGIDMEVLTTLAWFGLEAGSDGRLIRETTDGEPTAGWAGWTSEAFGQVRDRADAAGVRVVLTVERFAWNTAGKRQTKALLRDPAARSALANDIVEVISASGADGVNLDFEPLPGKSRGDFVRLVREVRAALDTVDPSLQLTFDLTGDVKSFPLKRLVADGAADAAVLMGYEYRTPGSRVAGSVAPLRDPEGLDLRDSVERALSRVPPGKVILALPWYGRAWSTRTDEPGSRTRQGERWIDPSTAFYRVSVPRAASAGRNFDQRQASAWSVYASRACETCPSSPRQLWYDDVDSVRAKVGFALRKKLRGVGIWALGYEGTQTELWSALRFRLGGSPDNVAPIGSAAIAPATIISEHDGVPVVSDVVGLELSAIDEVDGSGIAFVRVATRSRLAADGSLKHGTTFPAMDSLVVAMPDGDPVREVFTPGAASSAPAEGSSANPTPEGGTGEERSAAPEGELVTIRVQWRDVAGNWSKPVKSPVYYQPRD